MNGECKLPFDVFSQLFDISYIKSIAWRFKFILV